MIRPSPGLRERIAVLVALPLAVVVLAGVPLLAGLAGELREATAQQATTAAAAAVTPLLDALAAERNLVVVAAGVPAAPERLAVAQARSVEAAGRARAALGRAAPVGLTAAIDAVEPARARAGATPDRAAAEFGERIAALVDAVLDGVGPAGARTVDPLLRADERRSAVEGGLLLAVTDPGRARAAADLAVVADAGATVHLQRGPADVAAAADAPVHARIVALTAELRGNPDEFAAVREGRGSELLAEVSAAAGTRALLTRGTLAVLARDAAAATTAAALVAVVVGLVLLAAAVLVVTVGVRIGTSVTRPLRRLAAAADTVADLAGAELARRSDTGDVPPAFAAVAVPAPDELGELAASFNRVQAVAALLLERQVVLRRNSAAMLGHVGRRTRSLVARQLDLVDVLESGEQDPGRLERLYRLDHLTTRLRRNADALLVLADAREEDIGAPPLPLADVLRAALASIEGYQRVVLDVVADVTVAPPAGGDVTLLLAELLENAAAFSPPASPVTVQALADRGDGARIEIVDRGVGMSPAELVGRTRELHEPGRPEQAPSALLGLAVVGRICRRYGIGVALRPTPGGGTTAVVDLPRGVLVAGPGVRGAAASAHTPVAGMRVVPGAAPPGPRGGPTIGPVPGVGTRPGHASPRRPLRRRVPAGSESGRTHGTGRHQLVPPPPDPDRAADLRRFEDLDRFARVPAPRLANGHAAAAGPPLGTPPGVPPLATPPGVPPPPAGAAGLRRRVPTAAPSPTPSTPLLDAVTDAEAERAFVEELQAGVARAVERARAAAEPEDPEEQT